MSDRRNRSKPNTAPEAPGERQTPPECWVGSQRELAESLGLNLTTLRWWVERGLKTRSDQGHAVVRTARWVIARQKEQITKKEAAARRSSGADAVDGDGTILDYKRRLESKKLELQLLEAEKQVVSVSHVRDFLILVASRVKQLGNALQAQFGKDALLCLNEAVADLEQTVKRWEDGLVDEEIQI